MLGYPERPTSRPLAVEVGAVMTWRSAASIVVGAVVWMALFLALAIGLGQLWPDYAAHGRTWFEEGVFTFPPAMAASNLVLWVLAEIGAGFAAAKISARPAGYLTLAGLVTSYLALQHFVLSWEVFPWWYNVGVVVPAFGAVLLGARVARAVPAQAPIESVPE